MRNAAQSIRSGAGHSDHQRYIDSPPAALSESETGYRADHSTVCGASYDTFRRQRFLGVGGSGRSPLEFADPTGGAGVWVLVRVALENFSTFDWPAATAADP